MKRLTTFLIWAVLLMLPLAFAPLLTATPQHVVQITSVSILAVGTLTANASYALKYIDDVLSRGGEAAVQLWDVLSALRGPDDRLCDKSYTTEVIRTAAFPQTALLGGVANRAAFASSRTRFDQRGADSNGHFASHVRKAAETLGLIPQTLVTQPRQVTPQVTVQNIQQ
jgi:hypothetical protein